MLRTRVSAMNKSPRPGPVAALDAVEVRVAREHLGGVLRPAPRQDVDDRHVRDREDRTEQRRDHDDGHRHRQRDSSPPLSTDESEGRAQGNSPESRPTLPRQTDLRARRHQEDVGVSARHRQRSRRGRRALPDFVRRGWRSPPERLFCCSSRAGFGAAATNAHLNRLHPDGIPGGYEQLAVNAVRDHDRVARRCSASAAQVECAEQVGVVVGPRAVPGERRPSCPRRSGATVCRSRACLASATHVALSVVGSLSTALLVSC